MDALFTRFGTAYTGPVQQSAKGPYFVRARKCPRCGGAGGSDRWAATGYTCYDCGGNGRHPNGAECVRLYTGERLATLNAAKAKRDAKRFAKAQAKAAAEAAAADARRADFLAVHGALLERAAKYASRVDFIADILVRASDTCQLTDKQAAAMVSTMDKIDATKAAKAASNYVGTVGERLECKVTVERVSHFERGKFGATWINETIWVVNMRDGAGNAIVSMSPSFHAEDGQSFTIRATVKAHSEYRDEKQTKVNRVKILEGVTQ